jgi:alpha-tubulin suppressor-like RCC1 family protein
VVRSATGSFHSCLVLANGQAQCWGDNYHGALGIGTFAASSTTPETVMLDATTPLTNVVAISAGDTFTCAITDSGATISCWGENASGQRGPNAGTKSPCFAVQVM